MSDMNYVRNHVTPEERAWMLRTLREATRLGVDHVVDHHGRTIWERPKKPSLWAWVRARFFPQNPFTDPKP